MRIVAALAVVTAALVVCVNASMADMLDERPMERRLLFFSGSDIWSEGGFLHGGLLWSPDGLEHEGFALKLLTGAGVYRYRSGALGDVEVTGRLFSASFMPGWRYRSERFQGTIFAGVDIQDHRLIPDDPSSDLRGAKWGLRGAVELWYEPTASTMLALDASISTIGISYTARAAYGWRFLERLYLGPEVQALVCDDYRQYRMGLHATGFKLRNFELSASLGYARDSDERDGGYGRINLTASNNP